MYDIYAKPLNHPFYGLGEDTLIAQDGIIVGAIHRWFNPACIPGSRIMTVFIGQPIKSRGTGWRKMSGHAAELAQPWAEDVVRCSQE